MESCSNDWYSTSHHDSMLVMLYVRTWYLCAVLWPGRELSVKQKSRAPTAEKTLEDTIYWTNDKTHIFRFHAVTVRIMIFWVVAPCSIVGYQPFGGSYCLHPQGRNVVTIRSGHSDPSSLEPAYINRLWPHDTYFDPEDGGSVSFRNLGFHLQGATAQEITIRNDRGIK
jgi:hypothetical protein